MTDYEIKNLYVDGIKRVALTDGLSPANKVAFAGFYAGFRTAERLAKIEVLEDMLRMMDKLRFFSICDYKEAKSRIETMLSELKEANR